MLYRNNYPYYPNRNKGIELFVVSIILIVTGIYDSRWRVFKRPRLPAIARKYMVLRTGFSVKWKVHASDTGDATTIQCHVNPTQPAAEALPPQRGQ